MFSGQALIKRRNINDTIAPRHLIQVKLGHAPHHLTLEMIIDDGDADIVIAAVTQTKTIEDEKTMNLAGAKSRTTILDRLF